MDTDAGRQGMALSSGKLQQSGFQTFDARGAFLVSSTVDNLNTAPHIGQYRVSFSFDSCGPATIIAQ